MLRIGSYALKQHKLLPPYRLVRDIDLIMTFSEFNAWRPWLPTILRRPIGPNKFVLQTTKQIFEVEIAWPGTAAEALLGDERGLCEGGSALDVPASLPALLALKLSHRYLKNSPHFLKTMRDIQHLRSHGVELTPWLKEWLPWRESETYTYAHPSLMQDKKSFFNDAVPYKYDHDSIHEAMAYPLRPMYTTYAVEGEQVFSSREKFEALPDEAMRLSAVWEECAVLALERSIIPHGTDQNVAFMMALEKVCTSITSGWFREYAWEHYDDVAWVHQHVRPNINARMARGLRYGIVKPFKEITC